MNVTPTHPPSGVPKCLTPVAGLMAAIAGESADLPFSRLSRQRGGASRLGLRSEAHLLSINNCARDCLLTTLRSPLKHSRAMASFSAVKIAAIDVEPG